MIQNMSKPRRASTETIRLDGVTDDDDVETVSGEALVYSMAGALVMANPLLGPGTGN
jgi:hypothetical protein